MSKPFGDVQRVVLSGGSWRVAQHLVIGPEPHKLLHLLYRLQEAGYGPTGACAEAGPLQVSLGFSRRGLENARVPSHVLAVFGIRAPAFTAGAAQRAASHVGSTGASGPTNWDPAYAFLHLDAVLSLHAKTHDDLDGPLAAIGRIAGELGVPVTPLHRAAWLPSAHDEYFVHFGYRDNLSRLGIEGWTSERDLAACLPFSRHRAGEFVLGHPQNGGANPWLSDGRGQVLPDELRPFFSDGSFGVLHQMQQYVSEFEAFLDHAARQSGLDRELVRAKLCGRWADGRPLALGASTDPEADFGFAADPQGVGCPFGSHMRRMAPRDDDLEQSRQRPILRRGMPYGPLPPLPGSDDSRGLMGLFFCASIEEQFEHLLGQWGERVPLGSRDRGGARDPLIGSHEPGDGAFEIPRLKDDKSDAGKAAAQPALDEPIRLDGLRRFTRTRGTAYLFYPSLPTLQKIIREERFVDLRKFDE
jgi:deferrochelatase/peroxidase EfeB